MIIALTLCEVDWGMLRRVKTRMQFVKVNDKLLYRNSMIDWINSRSIICCLNMKISKLLITTIRRKTPTIMIRRAILWLTNFTITIITNMSSYFDDINNCLFVHNKMIMWLLAIQIISNNKEARQMSLMQTLLTQPLTLQQPNYLHRNSHPSNFFSKVSMLLKHPLGIWSLNNL